MLSPRHYPQMDRCPKALLGEKSCFVSSPSLCRVSTAIQDFFCHHTNTLAFYQHRANSRNLTNFLSRSLKQSRSFVACCFNVLF